MTGELRINLHLPFALYFLFEHGVYYVYIDTLGTYGWISCAWVPKNMFSR